MREQRPYQLSGVIARPDQPLIGIPLATNDDEEIIYFTDEADADRALRQGGTRRPIKLAGAWSDLDADAVLDDLDRLRHRSVPTPPITSL